MKKSIVPLAIIFYFWTAVLAAAEGNFGDLKYYEKANPYTDVKSAIAKGDLRFIALMGLGIYFPGANNYLENYSGYGYKVISGTSDVIQSYEHGRLTQIAQYYAEKYNQELIKYINEINSKKVAENIVGYEEAKKIFQINEVTLGNINMLPYSLHADLSLKKASCVNHAWWFNPVSNNKPTYDWNQFLKIFA